MSFIDDGTVKKRSQYRVATAFGTPYNQFAADSTYKATMDQQEPVQTTKVPPPPNNLGPLEGTMAQYKSENKKRFKAYDVQAPERPKVNDNLPIVDGSQNLSFARSSDEYNGNIDLSGRATPYRPPSSLMNEGDIDFTTEKGATYQSYDPSMNQRVQPPSDNLGPRDGTMKQYKTETQKKYPAYDGVEVPQKTKINDNLKVDGDQEMTRRDDYGSRNDGGRTTPFKPSTNLNQDGDIDFSTEKGQNYQYHNVTPNRGAAPSDNLTPRDGTMKQYKTETQKKYPAYDGVEIPQKTKINDNLKVDGDQEMTRRDDYGSRNDGGRSTPFKPSTNLNQDGDIDFSTEKGQNYQYHKVTPNRGAAPSDNLTPRDGTMKQYKTETQKKYPAYDGVEVPQKTKINDNLKVDGDQEMTRRDDYGSRNDGGRSTPFKPTTNLNQDGGIDFSTEKGQNYQYHNVTPNRGAAPSDNLTPRDGTMKQYKTETQKKYPSYDGVEVSKKVKMSSNLQIDGDREMSRSRDDYEYQTDGGRVTPFKPPNQLSNNGDFDFNTVNNQHFQQFDGQSTIVPHPEDHLHPLEGTMSQYKTEAQRYYKPYTGVTPSTPAKMVDHLDQEGTLNMETHKQAEYRPHDLSTVDRSKIRPSTSMANKGNIDWDTNKKSDYREYKVSKQEKIKAEDNLKPFAGKFKSKTEARRQYDGRTGEKVEPVRPNTTMANRGDIDWKTHKNAEFTAHNVGRTEALKAQDNLRPSQGKLHTNTESKSQYDGKSIERTTIARPGTSMFADGEYDWNTHKKEEYRNYDGLYKATTQKMNDNLQPSKGKLEGRTEHSDMFSNFPDGIQKTSKVKTSDNLKSNGLSFEEGTTGSRDYQAPSHWPIAERAVHQDNLILPSKKAKLEDKSVAKLAYQGPSPSDLLGAREPKARGQQGSLAPLDAPLEGKSEARHNYSAKMNYDRSKAFERPKPAGNLELNKASSFAPKGSTSMSDYKAGFNQPRPEKVRIGDHLVPNGGIESNTEYKENFAVDKYSKADLRAQPGWYQTLTTPFGAYADGQPMRFGQQFSGTVEATA